MKRVERKKKFNEIQRQNKIVLKYFQRWREIAASGVRIFPIFVKYYKHSLFCLGKYIWKTAPQRAASRFSRNSLNDTEHNIDDIRKQRDVISMRLQSLMNKNGKKKDDDIKKGTVCPTNWCQFPSMMELFIEKFKFKDYFNWFYFS